jgi:hypothetical protein
LGRCLTTLGLIQYNQKRHCLFDGNP